MIFVTGYPTGGTRVPMKILQKAGVRMGNATWIDSHDHRELVEWGYTYAMDYCGDFTLTDEMQDSLDKIIAELKDSGDQAFKYTSWLLPVLRSYFDEFKVIHITRDGRDVAARNKKMDWPHHNLYMLGIQAAPPDALETTMLHWALTQQKMYEDCAVMDTDSYLHVRLEDILDNPEPECRRILEFAGLDPDRADPSIIQRGSTMGCWRDLSSEEIQTLQSIGGEVLQRYGYPLVV
jgi:hypothetical protein